MNLGERALLHRGVSAVSALAAVVLVFTGATAIFVYSTLGTGNGNGATVTSTTFEQKTTFHTSYTTTTFSTTNSSTAAGWQEWAVLNASLGYYRTQSFIHDAWNYTFNVYQSGTNGNLAFISTIVTAVGPLTVSGNWTTGYILNYTRFNSLNVTVQYDPPSTYYQVFSFASSNSTGTAGSVTYNSTQKQAISIAMANASVSSFTQKYPTFVDAAYRFPSGNSSFGGDYLVLIFQVNGPRILGVFVNLSGGYVASTYNDTRAVRTCFSDGPCFSSPWGS